MGPTETAYYKTVTESWVMSLENKEIVFSFLLFITQFFEWLDDQNRVTKYEWWYLNKKFSKSHKFWMMSDENKIISLKTHSSKQHLTNYFLTAMSREGIVN